MIAASLIVAGAVLIGSGSVVAAVLSLRARMDDHVAEAADLRALVCDFVEGGGQGG